MTVTEKAAYLKGLAEGLNLDADKPETKLINAMIDVIDELALAVADLDDSVDMIVEQLDAVDEDLADVEDYLFEDDEDYEDEDTIYEAVCPACGATVGFDESFVVNGSAECPACGETLEFGSDDDIDDEDDQ